MTNNIAQAAAGPDDQDPLESVGVGAQLVVAVVV